jgi:hypothetical protein
VGGNAHEEGAQDRTERRIKRADNGKDRILFADAHRKRIAAAVQLYKGDEKKPGLTRLFVLFFRKTDCHVAALLAMTEEGRSAKQSREAGSIKKKAGRSIPVFFFLDVFIDGADGRFQDAEFLFCAGADHADNGLLEFVAAAQGAADKFGDLFLPGPWRPHRFQAVAQPVLLDVEDTADVCDRAVAGTCNASTHLRNKTLRNINFLCKSSFCKAGKLYNLAQAIFHGITSYANSLAQEIKKSTRNIKN